MVAGPRIYIRCIPNTSNCFNKMLQSVQLPGSELGEG
jgi:hypothetical protein